MKNWKIWVAIFAALAIILTVLFATPILGPTESSAVGGGGLYTVVTK